MAVDPRDFLLNTDYEMDKIVFFSEGELSNWGSASIQHDLGFAPLVFGVFSFSSDFSDSRPLPYEEVTATDSTSCDLYSASDFVYVTFQNQSGTHPKIYYRIYGFEPSDSTAVVAPTSEHAEKFVLNTDYNYCKLFKKGTLTSDGTVTHNLGYVPQVLAWLEQKDPSDPSRVYETPIDNSIPTDPVTSSPFYVAVTTTSVIFSGYSSQAWFSKLHYRIYFDEG